MSFPLSPTNNQIATLNGINYQYNSVTTSWTRVAAQATTFGNLTIGGNVTISGTLTQAQYPLVLNDISTQFNSNRAVFRLKTDQTFISNSAIGDSKNLQVVVNGLVLAPYVNELRWPWITPYDSYRGFRVRNGPGNFANLVIYNAPERGQQAVVMQTSNSATRQNRRYPFSATTVALGD